MSNSPVAASSATYRKAVNKIAEVLDKHPFHSKYPSLDFEQAIEDIPDAMKEKAIEWYIKGIKRGMAKATDLMASNEIYVENNTVYAPKKIEIKVKTKFSNDENWEPLTVTIKAKEIGFD